MHNHPMRLSRKPSGGPPGDTSGEERVLERFKPTNGIVVGWAGVLVAAFALGYSMLYVHSAVGLRIGLGAVFAGVVIWVTQLRPRATAYTRTLHLKGSLRDAHVPYVLVDEVTMGQTLNIWVGERRYVCIGIGMSMVADARQRAKKARQGSTLGTGRLHDISQRAESAAPDQTAMSYHTFVVTRIEELVDQAKRELRQRGETADTRVTQPYAVPEIGALVASGIAFLGSLLL